MPISKKYINYVSVRSINFCNVNNPFQPDQSCIQYLFCLRFSISPVLTKIPNTHHTHDDDPTHISSLTTHTQHVTLSPIKRSTARCFHRECAMKLLQNIYRKKPNSHHCAYAHDVRKRVNQITSHSPLSPHHTAHNTPHRFLFILLMCHMPFRDSAHLRSSAHLKTQYPSTHLTHVFFHTNHTHPRFVVMLFLTSLVLHHIDPA